MRGREYVGIETESVRGVTGGVDLDLAQGLSLPAHLTAGLLSTCQDHQESMKVCIYMCWKWGKVYRKYSSILCVYCIDMEVAGVYGFTFFLCPLNQTLLLYRV